MKVMLALKVELQCLSDNILEKLKREGGKRHYSHFAHEERRNWLAARDRGGNRDLRIFSHIITRLYLFRPSL